MKRIRVTRRYFDAAPDAPDDAIVAELPRHPVFRITLAQSALPQASAVTLCMLVRLQSPGPVAVPFAAHCVTTSASPGEKPVARTSTCWPDFSPVAGATAACCTALPVAVGEGDAAGVVAVATGSRRPAAG